MWSLVNQKIVTLRDLESWWSLDDVMKVCAVIELNADIAKERRKKIMNGKKAG